jgi:hypothetical protein
MILAVNNYFPEPHLSVSLSNADAFFFFAVRTEISDIIYMKNPVYHLSLLHISSLPASLLNALPLHQPIFTRKTSGHCLRTFVALNVSVFPS